MTNHVTKKQLRRLFYSWANLSPSRCDVIIDIQFYWKEQKEFYILCIVFIILNLWNYARNSPPRPPSLPIEAVVAEEEEEDEDNFFGPPAPPTTIQVVATDQT